MATEATLIRRAAAKVDMTRAVRPFFQQPAGYMNRQDRRRAARAKRLALKRPVAAPKPTVSQALEMIESEAPT